MTRSLLIALLLAIGLTACSKKEEAAPAAEAAPATEAAPAEQAK
jgi:PBP1b-binding outer membrane lipoprotein LpoB